MSSMVWAHIARLAALRAASWTTLVPKRSFFVWPAMKASGGDRIRSITFRRPYRFPTQCFGTQDVIHRQVHVCT
jgi:hypothetical protein